MMDRSFWRVLDAPRWTVLSTLGIPATRLHDELFQLTPGLYAMANAGLGGSWDDPGVAAVLWARSKAIALHLYDNQQLTDDLDADDGCPPPAVEVIGFAPLTFGGILAHEKARGERPMQTANYRFADSRFVCGSIETPGREYMFATANPLDQDQPMGIRFDLPI